MIQKGVLVDSVQQVNSMKTEISRLKKGDKLSRISFMEVLGSNSQSVHVRNEDGLEWYIGGSIVEDECYSTHYDSEEKIGKVEIAEILMGAKDAIIQVCFHKQATAETIKEQLESLAKMSRTQALKDITTLLKGAERVMIGQVVGSEPVLGRSILLDLEKKKEIKGDWDARTRQVDHRTIKWLVYKNVKYIVK